MEEDNLLRDLILSSSSEVKLDPEPSPEEIDKRIAFILETHECKGACNARTWLTPGIIKEFWLIFSCDGQPERMTWINYCPYCGYKPKEAWW